MSADEDVMAALADATGGTYFHNSNDLEGGFHRLTAAPEYLYLLEFSAGNVKQNGSYHCLKVKMNGKPNQDSLTVQSRRGYFAPKPPKKKKWISRFRQHSKRRTIAVRYFRNRAHAPFAP